MTSSDKHVVRVLGVDHLLDLAHGFGRMGLSRPLEAIEVVKKYFISNRPRGV